MRTKREAPARGAGGDRPRRKPTAATRKTGRVPAEPTSPRRTRTAPAREAGTAKSGKAGRSGPQTSPITRPVDRPARPKNASQAKARAKARKAKAPKVVRPKLTERLALRLASVDLRPRTLASKVPFVVLVIGSLAIGLGLTLWLSTDSAERSYQLSDARERTRMLQQQKDSLERDVHDAESAPALAEAARKLGMIPTRDTAHLVQDPGGSWVVVGTPKPADGVPPPPLNTKLPDENSLTPQQQVAPPPEVSVRVGPVPGGPAPLPRSGPQLLVRAPDGSTTLGTQQAPQLVPPSVPGLLPLPGQLPAQPQIPLQVQAPVALPALPQAPGPVVPPVPGLAVPGLAVPGLAGPPAPGPVFAPTLPNATLPNATLPNTTLPNTTLPNTEQFAPVAPTTPGIPR